MKTKDGKYRETDILDTEGINNQNFKGRNRYL